MRQNGRKSAASMAVVPLSPALRQPPPDSLSTEEAAEWTAIINRMPGGWFGREHQPLLTAFCRHTVEADRLSGMLTALDEGLTTAAAQGKHELDLICETANIRDQLLRMRERETRATTALARSMRLTQQSAYDKTLAASAQRSAGKVPWDRDQELPHEMGRARGTD